MNKAVTLSLQSARKRQSPQTGLVHHCYENRERHSDAIPVLENAYFALALFHTHLVESVLEGKAILQKLLAFQVDGNFPVYLHDFPNCHNRSLGLHLLPIFVMILKEYNAVLGEDLKLKLTKSIQDIVTFGQRVSKEKPLPYGAQVKLDFFLDSPSFPTPKSVYEWGELLIAAQMTDSIGEIWEEACRHWNSALDVYQGDENSPKQEGAFPLSSLYDFFMAESLQKFSGRLLVDHSLQIHAAIVHTYPFASIESAPPFLLRQHAEQKSFEILWQEEGQLYSLLCDAGKCSLDAQKSEKGLSLTFTFPEDAAEEGEEHIAFFLTAHPSSNILINKGKATLFQLKDQLEVLTGNHKIGLQFESEQSGYFSGHLSYSNRGTQIACTGANRFDAYDYKVGIRTVKRNANHVVCAHLTMHANT